MRAHSKTGFARLSLTALEAREVLSHAFPWCGFGDSANVTVETRHTPDTSVQTGASALMAAIDVTADGYARLDRFDLVPADGTDLGGDVGIRVYADYEGDGLPDATVNGSVTYNLDGSVTFDAMYDPLLRPGQPLHLLVEGDFFGAAAGRYGAEIGLVTVENLSGATMYSNLVYAGSQPAVITVEDPARLYVAGRLNGASDVVVENEVLPVYAFSVYADGADLALLRVPLTAVTGYASNATSYTLRADLTGDGVPETGVGTASATGNEVVFEPGMIVPRGERVAFEVVGRISASPFGDTLQLGLGDAGGFLVERMDTGAPVGADVTYADGKLLTIVENGVLDVASATTPIRSRTYLPGVTEDPGFAVTMTARYEDVAPTVWHIPVAGGRNVDRILIQRDGVTVATATVGQTGSDDVPTVVGGKQVVTFTARTYSGQLLVPEGTSVTYRLVPVMRSQEDGFRVGEEVQFMVDDGPDSILATGWTSSNNLDADDIRIGSLTGPDREIIGTAHVTAGIDFTASNRLPEAEGTDPFTGVGTAAAWKIEAPFVWGSAHNGLDKAAFDVLGTRFVFNNMTVQAESLDLYNMADTSVMIDGMVRDSSGRLLTGPITGEVFVSYPGLDTSSLASTLDSGGSLGLAVRTMVMNARVDPRYDSGMQGFLLLGQGQTVWFNRDAGANVRFDRTDLADTVVPSVRFGTLTPPPAPLPVAAPALPPTRPVVTQVPVAAPDRVPTQPASPPVVQTVEAPAYAAPVPVTPAASVPQPAYQAPQARSVEPQEPLHVIPEDDGMPVLGGVDLGEQSPRPTTQPSMALDFRVFYAWYEAVYGEQERRQRRGM